MAKVFKQGDHICALYETEEEQLTAAAGYLADGLHHGERCFYIAGSQAALTRFQAALMRLGVDADVMAKRDAMVEATHAEAHVQDGTFDSERMLDLLNAAVRDALMAGFTGLRICGDMSWLLDDVPGAQQVVVYEALLNHFFHGICAAGMCQYDRRRLPAHLIDHALATHSSVFLEETHKSNPFYATPAIARGRAADTANLDWKIEELRRRC